MSRGLVGLSRPRGRCGYGVSPAADYGEAQSAESRRDFIHKLKLCLKELRETQVWLGYAQRLELASSRLLKDANQESGELIAIFVKSIERRKGTTPAGKNALNIESNIE